MRRPQFETGHIYHLYNRGVEKRTVFLGERDYLRFVTALYEFNDSYPAFNVGRGFSRQLIEVRLQSLRRRPLVEILAFCLMPTHYHLMVRQKVDHGITEFMRKVGTGYTNYFNIKYRRVGPLFQGKFKAILLEREAHFVHLPHYIHLNPLELFQPQWRERGVKDFSRALNVLKTYRWSSLSDYLGRKNFPSVTEREFLRACIGGPRDFLGGVREWMRAPQLEVVSEIVFEE